MSFQVFKGDKGRAGGTKGDQGPRRYQRVPRGCQGVPKDDQGGQMYTRRCSRDGLQIQPRSSRDGPQTLHAERAGRPASRPASQPRTRSRSQDASDGLHLRPLPKCFRWAAPAALPETHLRSLPEMHPRRSPKTHPKITKTSGVKLQKHR